MIEAKRPLHVITERPVYRTACPVCGRQYPYLSDDGRHIYVKGRCRKCQGQDNEGVRNDP